MTGKTWIDRKPPGVRGRAGELHLKRARRRMWDSTKEWLGEQLLVGDSIDAAEEAARMERNLDAWNEAHGRLQEPRPPLAWPASPVFIGWDFGNGESFTSYVNPCGAITRDGVCQCATCLELHAHQEPGR